MNLKQIFKNLFFNFFIIFIITSILACAAPISEYTSDETNNEALTTANDDIYVGSTAGNPSKPTKPLIPYDAADAANAYILDDPMDAVDQEINFLYTQEDTDLTYPESIWSLAHQKISSSKKTIHQILNLTDKIIMMIKKDQLPEDLAQKTYELGQMQFLKTTTNWTASLELTSISDTSFILKMNLLNTLTNQIHATSLYKISRKSGKIIKGYFYYDINAFNDNTEDNNKSPSIKWVFDFSANDRHLMSLKVKDRDHKDNDHILWQWNQNDIKSLITDFYIKEANVSEFESEQSFRMFRPDFDEQLLYLAEVDPQNKSLIEPIYQIEMNPVSGDANVSIGSYDMQDPVWVGSDKNDTSESSEIVSESSPDVVSLDDLVTRSF